MSKIKTAEPEHQEENKSADNCNHYALVETRGKIFNCLKCGGKWSKYEWDKICRQNENKSAEKVKAIAEEALKHSSWLSDTQKADTTFGYRIGYTHAMKKYGPQQLSGTVHGDSAQSPSPVWVRADLLPTVRKWYHTKVKWVNGKIYDSITLFDLEKVYAGSNWDTNGTVVEYLSETPVDNQKGEDITNLSQKGGAEC